MTPTDLLTLAAEIESDTRIAPFARLIACAVLEGRAARMKAAKKGTGMVTGTARIETSETVPDLTPEPPLTTKADWSPR